MVTNLVPLRRPITASDAEGYTERSNDDQRDLQNRMADIQLRAAADAGLDLEQAISQPAGDGGLLAWPPETSELDLLTNYLRELQRELERVNKTLSKSSRIRMRLAVTSGLVEVAAQGIPGQAVIKATLLVNCQQLRETLRDARRESLVVIIDDRLYEDVVQTRLRGLRPDAYEPVEVIDKYGKSHHAWITIPGARRRVVPGVSSRGRGPGAASGQSATQKASGQSATQKDSADPEHGTGRKRGWPIPITVALIGAAGAIVAAVVHTVTSGGASDPPSQAPTITRVSASASVSASPDASSQTATVPTNSPTGKLYQEITDNHLGTKVYLDPMGDVSVNGPVAIPFGTKVLVKCWALNESGMGSINAFYLIAAPGQWAGDYAPADTFLNANSTTGLDPLVPQCHSAS